MTGDVGVDSGTWGHLRNIGRSGNFKTYIGNFGSYICGVRRRSCDGETSSQWAIGQEWSRCGCEYMGGYGIENDSGFGNGNGVAVVAWTEVHMISEMIPSASVAMSKFVVAMNAWLGSAGTETERVR